MKKVLSLVIAAIVVVAISSCGGKKDTPEAVAEKYLNHLNKKEFAEAKKIATEETGQMLDMMQSFSGVGGEKEIKEVKIENLKCETTEDKSACTYTADGKDETINLVKKDNKWLVEQKKEGTGENTEPVEEVPADSTAAVQ